MIEIVDKAQQIRRYELKVVYTCPEPEKEEPVLDTVKEFRYDKDAPVPVIDSISTHGEVTVLFSKPMQTRAVLTQDEIYAPSKRLLLAEEDFSI